LLGLGRFDLANGEFREAIDFFERAKSWAESLRDNNSLAESLLGLSSAYMGLRLMDRMKHCVDECIEFSYRHALPRVFVSALELRALYWLTSDLRAALADLERGLDVAISIRDKELEARTRIQLGKLFHLAGHYSTAHFHLDEGCKLAKEIENPPLIVDGRIFQAAALANRGNLEEAEHLALEAATIARQWYATFIVRNALMVLATVYKKRGKLTEAEQVCREILEMDDQVRQRQGREDYFKVSLGDANAIDHVLLQEILADQNRPVDFLEVSERGRARAFADLLRQRGVDEAAAEPVISIEALLSFARETGSTIVEYTVSTGQSWEPIPVRLAPQIFICVVSPQGSVQLRRWSETEDPLPRNPASKPRHRSPETVSRVLTFLEQDVPEASLELEDWSQLLIAGIEDLLPENPSDTVIFIPDVLLLEIPFAALLHSSGERLVDRHSIIVAPSIQVLVELRRRRREKNQGVSGALVVGDPDGTLEFARAEAREIAEMLDSEATIGEAATKDFVLAEMPKRRILHFATHGKYEDLGPLTIPGAIVLAPSGQRQTLLGSEEIRNLTLDADLVVLSACDTARGRLTTDGVIGLTRAFLAAGARTCIVALWKIPDDVTQILMSAFYEAYRGKIQGVPKEDKAGALQHAMIAARKHDENPKSWAAFILVGDRY
jgi:CHAT domain-containing protein